MEDCYFNFTKSNTYSFKWYQIAQRVSYNLILHGKPDPLLKSSKYLAETSMFSPVQCGIDATVTNNVIIILTQFLSNKYE